MRNEQIATRRRSDYQPPLFLVERIELEFDLDPDNTVVAATLTVRRNTAAYPLSRAPLLLDGEDLRLESLHVNGQSIEAPNLTEAGLSIEPPTAPDSDAPFAVRIRNRIQPSSNTELMGLFLSRDSLFTQCEAEGFRRISFFPDRPDVMSTYVVTLRADKARFPVLLSNGNLVAQGDLPEGRHYARWEDPFRKPSYLFALVAGKFVAREERVRTGSGRERLLQVWVEPGQLDKTEHAMQSLIRSIQWDERRFGLELDLDRFMIVASNDFNMGAMENKGLNIFNAKYVLAHPGVATDLDYANIESIVGHEYFHNWSGNRVTCRDWFQLSLKEGLTVFRDQEFSADMMAEASAAEAAHWARAVKRIDDVRNLRATQFPEDAGPMAHPVRPEAYQQVANFYTATVYEKGAEVVRMLQTLLGVEGFRRGMDLYFRRHDGQAVTCDDFVSAMADANGRDLTQFRRWYAQTGTPRVAITSWYDEAMQRLQLHVVQSLPPQKHAADSDDQALHIPLAVGLVGPDGEDLSLRLQGEPEGAAAATTRVLDVRELNQSFTFEGVPQKPVLSLARNFSAPVAVEYDYSDAELAFLAAHDSDGFNRWEAIQRLAVTRLASATDACEAGRQAALDEPFLDVLRKTLRDAQMTPAFKEQALQLPAESFIAEQRAVIDPDAIRSARQAARRAIGEALLPDWQQAYQAQRVTGPYSPEPSAAGKRGLRNLALGYWVDSGDAAGLEAAHAQLTRAENMTDMQAALAVVVNSPASFKAEALVQLARLWGNEPLLMNKWFQVQATAIAQPGEPPVLERVRSLLKHPAFSLSNPNNVYALILSFCVHNAPEFHRPDGSGYAFWLEHVLQLDRLNATVAARLARALERWRKFTPDRQKRMRDALEEVARAPKLSRDVREIVTKALEN